MRQRYPVWLTLALLSCEHDARLGFACPGSSLSCVLTPAADGGSRAPSDPPPTAAGSDADAAPASELLSVSILNQSGEPTTQAELGCDTACVEVRARANGGTPPYRFEWDDGSTTPERSLCPEHGTSYTLRVLDSRGLQPVAAAIELRRASCPPDAGAVADPGACRRFSVGEYMACGNVGTSSDMPHLTAAAHTLRVHSNLETAGAMQVTGVGDSCSFSEPLGSFSLPTGPSEQTLCLTPTRELATLMITTTSGGSAAFLTNPDSYVELCEGCD